MVVGVVFAGAPLLAFDYWISRLIERQNVEDVATSAKRTIGLAETRVGQVVRALDELAALGVSTCTPENLNLMRHMVFETTPVKGVAIVGPGGEIICTHA